MIYVLKFLLSGLPVSVFESYASTPTKLFTLTDSSDILLQGFGVSFSKGQP